MYNKELIDKICNLTCTFDEINIPQDSIKYDTIEPFKKYYSIDIILKAIEKYENKEWSDHHFAHWCCLYDWIICGGFKDNIIEDKNNTIREFIKSTISWDLDGLSFFDEKSYFDEDDEYGVDGWKIQFKNLDYILNKVGNLYVFYGPVYEYDLDNAAQYVVLVNDLDKTFIIIYSDFFENGYEEDKIKYVDKKTHKKMVEDLLNNGYQLISYSEEFYFDE